MMRVQLQNQRIQKGYVIILALILVLGVITLGILAMGGTAANYAASRRTIDVDNANYAAEAGVTDTMQLLKSNSGFTGISQSSPHTLYSRTPGGKATYWTSVTNNSNGTYTVDSYGLAYRSVADTTPMNTKHVRAVITQTTQLSQNSSNILVGSGNAWVGYNSIIKGGTMYIAGKLSQDIYSQTGTSSNPITLNVGNVACGTSSTWPQPCGAGSEPINLNDTFSSAKITGTVCATNQTTATRIVTLTPNCTAPTPFSPTFDKQSFVANMNSTTKIAGSSVTCPWPAGGTYVIPANAWITGSININTSFFGNCKIYFAGDAYIEGNITINSWTSLNVADSAGSRSPTIVLNGTLSAGDAGIYGGLTKGFAANSSGTPAHMISFYSNTSSCSNSITLPSSSNPTCLTTAQAQASANNVQGGLGTEYDGLYINGSGAGTDLSGLIFYSYYGCSYIADGPVKIGALGGQCLDFSGNSGTITPTQTSNIYYTQPILPLMTVTDYQQIFP